MRLIFSVLAGVGIVLCGCVAPEESMEPMVDSSQVLTYLGEGIQPETLLFPEFLLMEGMGLGQHGRIPSSQIVGLELTSKETLNTIRRKYSNALATHFWKTEGMEIAPRSFLLTASHKGEQLEIRAVQGSGPTQIFILYTVPK